jgi:hypothetical protein
MLPDGKDGFQISRTYIDLIHLSIYRIKSLHKSMRLS